MKKKSLQKYIVRLLKAQEIMLERKIYFFTRSVI